MEKYKIKFEESIKNDLNRIQDKDASSLKKFIKTLGDDPRPHDFEEIRARNCFRVRLATSSTENEVGNKWRILKNFSEAGLGSPSGYYNILYTIDEINKDVTVIKIDTRSGLKICG